MTDFDYENDVSLDEDSLDVEWLEQAGLALKYGRHVADLRLEAKQLDERKKVVRSELIKEANAQPEACTGKVKPNAADIEAYYYRHPRYQETVNELLEKQHELELAEVAKNEIAFTRKAALENLVRLHGQQYFAGPSVPRDLSQERQKRAKQKNVDKNVKVGSRRRTS